MEKNISNITDKNIRDFGPEDTIYIKKIIGNYDYSYYCRFVKFEKGIVTAEIISHNRQYGRNIDKGKIITTRPKNCYLWGKFSDDKYMYEGCHWFNKNGTVLKD